MARHVVHAHDAAPRSTAQHGGRHAGGQALLDGRPVTTPSEDLRDQPASSA